MKNPKENEQTVQDKAAEHYEALRYTLSYAQQYHDWWIEQMVRLIHHENRRGITLDNGCGTGILLERLFAGQLVLGLDLSWGMLTKAQPRSRYLTQASSLALPFPKETFDLVIARSLLHHLPDPEKGLAEMSRVLKSTGQVILADTNNSILSNLPRKIAYRRESFSSDHKNLNSQQYLAWFSRHFQLEHIQYFGYLAYPFGFPDMMGPFRHIPFPRALVNALTRIDSILSTIPGIKTQSWGLIIAGTKR